MDFFYFFFLQNCGFLITFYLTIFLCYIVLLSELCEIALEPKNATKRILVLLKFNQNLTFLYLYKF